MNTPAQSWQKLAEAARRSPGAQDESAPFGFSTRVAALAFARAEKGPFMAARMALRAAMVACALALVALAFNYSAITSAFDTDTTTLTTDDPVAEIVNMGS